MGKLSLNVVDTLEAQASLVAEAAAASETGLSKDQLFSAARTLKRLAKAEQRKTNPVLDLPVDASEQELRTARQRRAVRRGKDIYLPSWTDAAVALPNPLLRSALFAASAISQGFVRDSKLAVQGDVTLSFTGERLTSYDRKTFAACLEHYRENRPLSAGSEGTWVSTTYWAFAAAIGVQYGANVHRAIRASLLRLNSANLRVRVKRLSVPLPRLVDVAFEEGFMDESTPDEELKGSDAIVFRIDEAMAQLFGPTDWSAVPKQILLERGNGLVSWLATYYATHSGPYEISFDVLYERSGVTCNKAEFRRMLQSALKTLSDAPENDESKVERYAVTKKTVWVCLKRWGHTGACPLKISEDI